MTSDQLPVTSDQLPVTSILDPPMLEDLRGFGFSWQKIADILGVSRWTIYRRVHEYGLRSMSDFSLMSDGELDNIISENMNQHGKTTEQSYITGYLRSKGLRVQRSRVRQSMAGS